MILSEGSSWEMMSYNAKDKYQGKQFYEVISVEGDQSSLVATIHFKSFDKNDKEVMDDEMSFSCENGVVKMDMSEYVPAEMLESLESMEFEIEVDIPESYADDLAMGMAAEVNLNGQTHLAKLVTISPEIENNQVTGRVRFTSSSDQQASQPTGLRQNQRLTTRILMENKQDVLMVQRGQFLETGNGRVAYVVKDNMAQRTSIQTGARSLSSVEISQGLQAGDTIIVSGTDQFNGAQSVLITQ
jgi:hypothetical protein